MGIVGELADKGLYGCRIVVSFDRGIESNCGHTVLCLPPPHEPPQVPSAPPSSALLPTLTDHYLYPFEAMRKRFYTKAKLSLLFPHALHSPKAYK